MDDEAMGGVTEHPQTPGLYTAFLVNYLTNETLGYHEYGNLAEALKAINRIERPWRFESVSDCGDGQCGSCEEKTCQTGLGCAHHSVAGATEHKPTSGH